MCGEGPSLECIFTDDGHLSDLQHCILVCWHGIVFCFVFFIELVTLTGISISRDASPKHLRLLMSIVPSLNLIEPSMKRMNYLMQMNLQELIMVCVLQLDTILFIRYYLFTIHRCAVLSEVVRPLPP